MNQAYHIISKFGGIRKLARLGGYPPSTVQGWRVSGVIPARRQAELLTISERHNIGLSPSDFFDLTHKDGEAA